MIDPFDLALSDFIDSLPEESDAARRLLDEAAPFSGHGDLPELAELATMLRSVPEPEPRPEWMAAAKERLMAAPIAPPEKRGLTWLGTMFLPLSQLTFPSLPKLSLPMPAPVFARAVAAAVVVVTLGSMAASRTLAPSPLMQVTGQQGPIAEAQQAIAALQQQLGGSDSSPRDIVLLSKQLQLADDAIDQAPPAEQPRLRAQLQGAVRAVRFDGTLEAVLNPTTVEVDGVAIQADAALVQRLHVGQHVSLQVTVTSNGKLQAVDVTPDSPAATNNGAGASVQTDSASSNRPGSGARGRAGRNDAPPAVSQSVPVTQTDDAQGPSNTDNQGNDGAAADKKVKASDASPKADKASNGQPAQDGEASSNGKGNSFKVLSSVASPDDGGAGSSSNSASSKHDGGDSPSTAAPKGASANAQAATDSSGGSSVSANSGHPAASSNGGAGKGDARNTNSSTKADNGQGSTTAHNGQAGNGNGGAPTVDAPKNNAPKADAPKTGAPKAGSSNSSPKSENPGKKK